MHSILIVDDESPFRRMVRLMLATVPYTLLEAADGTTGLQMAQQARPDLMLLDVNLPGLDGWEVLRALQADPATAGIKVVIVSANGDADEASARAAGAVGLLRKPFRMQALREYVGLACP
jgi:CheY-like chemotaxis protein